jgi:hypothetical protein
VVLGLAKVVADAAAFAVMKMLTSLRQHQAAALPMMQQGTSEQYYSTL